MGKWFERGNGRRARAHSRSWAWSATRAQGPHAPADTADGVRPVCFGGRQGGCSRRAAEHSSFAQRAGTHSRWRPGLRQEVSRARGEFRVSNIRTQTEIESATIRERLLATLALFFAVVALVLAAIGLYGVLDYSVLQRRREIGIRMAIGARAGNIAWRVTAEVFTMVLVGSVAGLALGLASVRYVESLLFQVRRRSERAGLPSLTILAALLAAFPA